MGTKTVVDSRGVITTKVAGSNGNTYEQKLPDLSVPVRQPELIAAGADKDPISKYITIMWPNSAAGVTASLPNLLDNVGKEFIITKVGNTFPVLVKASGSQTIDTTIPDLVMSASYGNVHLLGVSGSTGPVTWFILSRKTNAFDDDAGP